MLNSVITLKKLIGEVQAQFRWKLHSIILKKKLTKNCQIIVLNYFKTFKIGKKALTLCHYPTFSDPQLYGCMGTIGKLFGKM